MSGFAIVGPVGGNVDLSGVERRLDAIEAQLVSGQVEVVTPHTESGGLHIVRGDSTTLKWSSDDWPSLDEANVFLSMVSTQTGERLIDRLPVEIVNPSSPASIKFELSSTITSNLHLGRKAARFDVEANFTDGRVLTLTRGYVQVDADTGV